MRRFLLPLWLALVFAATTTVAKAAMPIAGEPAAACGVLASSSRAPHAERATFLIHPRGNVVKVYMDVDPEKHAARVLIDMAPLKAAS